MTSAVHDVCSQEYAADQVTKLGLSPLLLTGLLDDSSVPTPAVVSAVVSRGETLLTYLLCERASALNGVLAFLESRGIRWRSENELWQWASVHHWPGSGSASGQLTSPEKQLESAKDEQVMGTEAAPELILSSVTQQGRYGLECCFALDNHIVAWDSDSNQFRFPVIHDFLLHQACVKMLATRQATFSLNRPWLDQEYTTSPPSLDPVRHFGVRQNLPHIASFLSRVSYWEKIRHYLSGRAVA